MHDAGWREDDVVATTTMTVQLERAGQVTIIGQLLNIDSATSLAEDFRLPIGFGDCFVTGVRVTWSSIETVVAAGAMRGPDVNIVVSGLGAVDMIAAGEWRRQGATSLVSTADVDRPVLWRAEELLRVISFGEDTGAADTSDITVLVRVVRLRNQSAPRVGGFTYPQP